jgi:hypothetical protein
LEFKALALLLNLGILDGLKIRRGGINRIDGIIYDLVHPVHPV